MKTLLFICAIACGVLAIINLLYARKARTTLKTYEKKISDFQSDERILEAKKRRLSFLEANNRKAKRELDEARTKMVHVGYTVTLNDPDGTRPEYPDKAALKALKSGIGYKTGNTMKKHIKCIREGGKTRYSLDVYLMPYNE